MAWTSHYHHQGDSVLDLWEVGRSAPEIVKQLGLKSEQDVHSIIRTARRKDDPRAVRREQARYCAEAPVEPSVPLLAPAMGIEAVTRVVRALPSHLAGDFHMPVSVARVRCLEDVG